MAQCFSATVTTPGTPQQLVGTTAPAQAALTGSLAGNIAPRGSFVVFQADPSNTASKYLYIGQKGMVASTRSGVAFALAPGAFSPPVYVDGEVNLGDFYIDIDTGATTKNVLVMVAG